MNNRVEHGAVERRTAERRVAEHRTIVLVVEDEPLQRMMAVDLVEDAGFEAIEAADATQAVGILEHRTDIRLVLSDIGMPRGVNGVALAALIHRHWPPIALILTSNKLRPSWGDIPVGGVFFSKPYREHELIAAMRRMIGD